MFKIYSQFDCLLNYNGKEVFLSENENLDIETPLKINVYPLNNKLSFVLDLENLTDNQFYKTKKDNDTTYIVLVQSFFVHKEDIHSFKNSPYPFEVSVSKSEISFTSSFAKKTMALPPYTSYKVSKIKNLCVCIFDNNNYSFIVVYNPKNDKIKTFNDVDTFSDDKFIIKEDYFDLEYKIDNDGLKNSSFTLNKPIPEELIAYQFMLSVKLQGYDFAFSLLSKNMQEKISTKDLREFLSDIKFFKFIKKDKCLALSASDTIILSFNINNNKIEDISSD